jgi:hypothetical protein
MAFRNSSGRRSMGRFTAPRVVLAYVCVISVKLLSTLAQENRLMISDPATLKYILSHPGTFVKSPQQQLINRTGLGQGSLLYVEGE